MRACKVDERQLGEWIDAATGTIRYLGPGLAEAVAEKLVAAERRTGQRNHVVVELDDEMDRSGFGQTSAIRKLKEAGVRIQRPHGLRIAALACPGIAVVWSPIAERVDSVDRVAINGVWMEGSERDALRRWMSRAMGEQGTDTVNDDVLDLETHATRRVDEMPLQSADESHDDAPPNEPNVNVTDLDTESLEEVEAYLAEHPPRDFRRERATEVYQGYVGFIEMHVQGAWLAEKTSLTIPEELTEVGLDQALRRTLSERMRIDLSERVDLGAKDVNKRVDAFREIFTTQLGPPLGRIYKKSDWAVMQRKWSEIKRMADAANDKIQRHLRAEVSRTITAAANEWARAIKKADSGAKDLDAEKVQTLLLSQWKGKQRATRVRVQMFVKDLTWETLNDETVRQKIEDAYPELRDTGLYKSRQAWAGL